MKKIIKGAVGLLTAMLLCTIPFLLVHADTTEKDAVRSSIIANTSTPYIALGQDLTDGEKSVVLSKFGISDADLANCSVSCVTNEMEHRYLDGKIDSSVIGTRAISCVMIKKGADGQGIHVTTENISYCTISMYKNALITAGVKDADVYVAGPSMISGTAALIGCFEAYEEMSGETIGEDRRETAITEIVTIGDLSAKEDGQAAADTSAGTGTESETIEELFSYIKAKVIAEGLTDPDKIAQIIEEAEQYYNIELSGDQIANLQELMSSIGELDIDPEELVNQAGDLYNQFKDSALAGVIKDAAKDAAGKAAQKAKQGFWTMIGNFFRNIWSGITGQP